MRWTYGKCLELAKRCKTRCEFKKSSDGAYRSALRNGWIDSFEWFVDGRKQGRIYKWTAELCTEEARKYVKVSDFCHQALGAYKYAKRHNLLKSFVWFKEYIRKSRVKWTHDAVIEEAKKYKTRTEFGKGCGGAYTVAMERGWINECTWFVERQHRWTREECYTEALKYTTRNGFRKGNSNAAQKASKMGWMADYTWFENGYIYQKKWTREKCLQEGKLYDSRGHFKEGNPGCYRAARQNGWLDEMTWFRDLKDFIYGRIYSVYRYVFPDASVYVGLTMDKVRRDRDHKSCDTKNVSSVRRHFDEMNKERKIPEVFKRRTIEDFGKGVYNNHETIYTGFGHIEFPTAEYLEDGLTAEEAREREGFWVKWHCEHGYCVLNKARTGKHCGSLGGLGRKWTKERCYEEAKHYKTKKEFQDNSPSCYQSALKHGWLADYTWFPKRYRERNGRWKALPDKEHN